MRFRPKKPAPENAARLLPRLAEEFFQAGDQSVNDDLKGEEVHPFRIMTKRFRYALEYFRPCYGGAMDGYIRTISGLQQILGELNDCCSSRGLCREVLKAGDPPARYQKLFAAFDRREADLLTKYQSHWRNTFQNAALRKRWNRYLAHPPAANARPRAKAASTPG